MTGRRAGLWLLRLLPFLLLGAVGWYQLPGVGRWEPGEAVAFHHSSYARASLGVVLVVWVLLLVTLLRRDLAARVSPMWWQRWCLICALVAMPLFEVVALGGMVCGWHDVSQLRAQDGSLYRVRRSLPAYLLTLELSRGLLFTRERVVGYGDTDFPALLVRPTAGPELDQRPASTGAASSLVQSADGRWLTVLMALEGEGPDQIASCQTHLVYDLRARKVYGATDFQDLSPFILVGPRDQPTPSDVRALLARPGRVFPVGLVLVRPSAATTARDLSNPNPEVRAAAARLLDTQNTENSDLEGAADLLRQTAASSDDAIARRAAESALARLEAAQHEAR